MMAPVCPLDRFPCSRGCVFPCASNRTFGLWFREPTAGDLVDLARDLSAMDEREIFALTPHRDRNRLARELYALLPRAFRAYTIGLDTSPAAIAFLGLWPQDESAGLLGASLFGTNEFPVAAGRIVRWVRRSLIPELLELGVRRVECRALAEHRAARNFIRACGAVEEATMPDLGRAGETYILSAWRKSDWRRSDDVHLQHPEHAGAG